MSSWEIKAREVAAELGTNLGQCTDLMPDEWRRFLLVEANVSTPAPPFWLSTHDSHTAATVYWRDQETRGAWQPFLLVDLDTGQRYEPQLTLQWQVKGEAMAA